MDPTTATVLAEDDLVEQAWEIALAQGGGTVVVLLLILAAIARGVVKVGQWAAKHVDRIVEQLGALIVTVGKVENAVVQLDAHQKLQAQRHDRTESRLDRAEESISDLRRDLHVLVPRRTSHAERGAVD